MQVPQQRLYRPRRQMVQIKLPRRMEWRLRAVGNGTVRRPAQIQEDVDGVGEAGVRTRRSLQPLSPGPLEQADILV